MYIILVHDDNTLSAPKKERIMQRSKLVDNLWFLSHPIYKGYDMTNCSVLMEYVLPISKKYKSEILVKSDEMYEDHLKYILPIDTELTAEAGDIEIKLTFALADIDANGNPIQRIRKVDPIYIHINPISAWSDIIPDEALSAIDQRLIKTDAQIKALADIGNLLSDTKADNLRYNIQNGELQLVAGNKAIGNKVTIVSCTGEEHDEEQHEDCVPVVEF